MHVYVHLRLNLVHTCGCYTEKAPNAWQRRGTRKTRNTYNQPNRPNRQTSQTKHQALPKRQPGRRITPINTAAVHASAQQPTISTHTRFLRVTPCALTLLSLLHLSLLMFRTLACLISASASDWNFGRSTSRTCLPFRFDQPQLPIYLMSAVPTACEPCWPNVHQPTKADTRPTTQFHVILRELGSQALDYRQCISTNSHLYHRACEVVVTMTH